MRTWEVFSTFDNRKDSLTFVTGNLLSKMNSCSSEKS